MQDKLGAHTVRHKLLTLYQQNLSRYTWEMKHFSGIFQTILYDNKITWQIYNLWSSSLKELFKSFPKKLLPAERTNVYNDHK